MGLESPAISLINKGKGILIIIRGREAFIIISQNSYPISQSIKHRAYELYYSVD